MLYLCSDTSQAQRYERTRGLKLIISQRGFAIDF